MSPFEYGKSYLTSKNPIFIPTFSSAFVFHQFHLFCEFIFIKCTKKIVKVLCGTDVLLEARTTRKQQLSLMFMFSLSFFSHVYLPASMHGTL